MLKRVALLHTVRSVLESFEPMLRAAVPGELKVHNMLDEFLASDPAETGEFSAANLERLANDLKNGALTGADVVVATCSTLSPHVAALRPSFRVPIVAIDDAMCREAVARGARIAVLATARSTVDPTVSKLRREARAAGRAVELRHYVADEAYAAIKRGERSLHDELVLRMAGGIDDCDLVVLAQASMAHLEAAVGEERGVPVLSSPALCVAQIRKLLEG